MYVQDYKRTGIKVKTGHPETLKKTVFLGSLGLLSDGKVQVEDVIAAAKDVQAELVKLKFNKLSGMGTSKIDTSICINFNNTLFTLEDGMSEQAALKVYQKLQRDKRREQLGLKLATV